MVELFIAIRHIKERKFQSIISIIGVSLALIVFISSLAISNGLKQNMLNSLLTVNPDITVAFINQKEGEYRELIDNIKQEDIISISPNIDIQGYIKYESNNVIPLIKATDITKLNVNIIEGGVSSDMATVMIGDELQKYLGIKIGDYLNIISLNGRELRLKLVGVFKTGFLSYDQNLVIIPTYTGQVLEQKGDVVSNIVIKTKNPSNINLLKSIENKIMNTNNNIYTYNWTDENANLLSAIQFEEFILIVILSFLFLISSFVISVILSISVREKTQDIGILKAFGFEDSKILKIFLYEGIFVGVSGIIISAITTPIVLKIIQIISSGYIQKTYYLQQIPIEISFKEILIIYLVELVMVFLASIIPARKASKLDPTDAIRFNL